MRLRTRHRLLVGNFHVNATTEMRKVLRIEGVVYRPITNRRNWQFLNCRTPRKGAVCQDHKATCLTQINSGSALLAWRDGAPNTDQPASTGITVPVT